MAKIRAIQPDVTRFYRLTVARVTDVGQSFRRVTATGADLAQFTPMGYDQWFRLFVPLTPGQPLRLPTATNKLWYPQWLAIAEAERPHVANYSVRAYRSEVRELDIDVVIHHTPTGNVEGRVAIWASQVEVGAEFAILDQGLIYNPPADTTAVYLAVDETGLPAAESILASLPRHVTGHVVLEVPHRDDIRPVDAPPGMTVHWVSRDVTGPHAVPGAAALAALRDLPTPADTAYAFLVGEADLPTGARRHFVGAGLAKSRITFCGYWKH